MSLAKVHNESLWESEVALIGLLLAHNVITDQVDLIVALRTVWNEPLEFVVAAKTWAAEYNSPKGKG